MTGCHSPHTSVGNTFCPVGCAPVLVCNAGAAPHLAPQHPRAGTEPRCLQQHQQLAMHWLTAAALSGACCSHLQAAHASTRPCLPLTQSATRSTVDSILWNLHTCSLTVSVHSSDCAIACCKMHGSLGPVRSLNTAQPTAFPGPRSVLLHPSPLASHNVACLCTYAGRHSCCVRALQPCLPGTQPHSSGALRHKQPPAAAQPHRVQQHAAAEAAANCWCCSSP